MRPKFAVDARHIAVGIAALAVGSPFVAGALAAETRGAGGANADDPVAHAAVVKVRKARLTVTSGRRAVVQGVVRNAEGGEPVALQRRSGGRWRTIVRRHTRRNGAFRLRFTPRRASSSVVRVRFGRRGATVTKRIGRLKVFRSAPASYYGPGLYGNRLGCGGTLTPSTLGVAHKSMPCGTRLTVRYRGRSVRVKVIDRGPYAGDREFDLTAATKNRIRFPSTGRVQVSVG